MPSRCVFALCDTLALMDCQPAIGKLHQALSLRHRRVQTEAAYALARLDQEIGRQTLIGLAAEPVARLRSSDTPKNWGCWMRSMKVTCGPARCRIRVGTLASPTATTQCSTGRDRTSRSTDSLLAWLS